MPDVSAALCAIVRDEIHSVIEWLAHYKALGFREFLIHDNGSTDGTAEVLQALMAAGEVSYIHWPHAIGKRPQRLAYENARAVATADWLAYFDADEFLFLRDDASIGDFLGRFDALVGAVTVNWIVFGSDGHEVYEPVPVIERFTDALPPDALRNRTVKTIARRGMVSGNRVHNVMLSQGRYVNPSLEEVRILDRTAIKVPDFSVAALHHYAIKSIEEHERKRNRGHANSHDADAKRNKIDLKFREDNAGGVRNTDLQSRSGRMRAEAMRLREVLLAAGLSFPVWPFVEAGLAQKG